MSNVGDCTVWPGKCHFSSHHNAEYILKLSSQKKTQTPEELEKLFCDAKSSKSKSEQIIDGFAEQLESVTNKCLVVQNKLRESMNKLRKIALQPSCFETTNEYLDLMIQNEKQIKEKGWDQRIAVIQQLNEKNKQIEEMSTQEQFIHKTKQQILDELLAKEFGKGKKSNSFFSYLGF